MPRRLLMTGTPIQNNLTELWALMHFCMPSVFGTLNQFLSSFKEAGDFSSDSTPSKTKEQFKSLKYILKAFMLRRTKSKLIECGNLVLPPLTEITVMAPLVSMQKKVYTSILRKELSKLLALNSGSSGHQSLQNIVIQLRKACSHPYLFPGIEPEPYEEGEHLVQGSGKLMVLDQLLRKLYVSGHRVLLFAQMTHTLDILQDFLELRKYSYERLDGSIRAEERFAAIRSFSKRSAEGSLKSESDQNAAFIFMISTRAGGVGLNLVAADTVIFYEQDWNPQVDKQALQRAHRIGQMNHVLSINLVTEHSVEEVIMRRAERKLQLSHNVVGDHVMDQEGKEMAGAELGDLRSIIFGLHMFDPTEINKEEADELKTSELSAMAEKVIAMRHEQTLGKNDSKFEINIGDYDHDVIMRGSSSVSADPGLDEASYLSWVEKFKAASQSVDNQIMELESRRNFPEDRHLKVEAAKKKAEEKKKTKWEAHGYHSLSVQDPCPVDGDMMSDSGSVVFVYGDCTDPSKVCPSEPAIIFSCIDNSGNWGHGGMFDALAKLSAGIPDAYERASEFQDLHLGDLHLIRINEDCNENNIPWWVALAVVQSYNPRRKVPRSDISLPDLERCLSKASFSAAENSASIHMPRIGYQDGSDRSQWYTVERLLRKYASIYGVKIFVREPSRRRPVPYSTVDSFQLNKDFLYGSLKILSLRLIPMREDESYRNRESRTRLAAQNDGLGNDGLIPQLFTSLPALNEAASYLAQTTTYLTGCFSDYSVEPAARDPGDSIVHAQELVTFSSGESEDSVISDHPISSGSSPTLFESSCPASTAPANHVGVARASAGDPSEDTGVIVQSNHTGQNGISIFQGLIERARRTVRGSADDIGWLKRDPEMPPVQDGTERFMEILDNIRHGLHKLPSSMVYLLVPGLFSNHGPLYFVNTKISFSKMGLICHIAKIHSEASVEKNAREIKDYIEEIYWGSKKRVLLLGHSKGGVDAAAALSIYWSDLKDKVAGLALAQSPYGGSPIASDILREGQLGDYVNQRKLMEILICKVIKGDMQALEDLTYERRKEFLKKHHLPRELPVVSFHTEAGISPAVLATLSHVAHAELPLMAPLSAGQPARLPVVMPLGAAMAACAQLLQVRYGEKSDGLVTCCDAEVPGSVVVRPKRKLDHAWMVYSSLKDDPSEADAAQVCEALLTMLVEVGQRRRRELSMKDE
ncbi:hypothetical protein REPUB_Repub17cG0179900 [Reevesia pubescens]